MAKPIDILIDESFDEVPLNGDVAIGDATQQNQLLLIIQEKGENKMEPPSGVGINTCILDEADGDDLKKEISAEFEGDGMRIISMQMNSLTELNQIKATYGE